MKNQREFFPPKNIKQIESLISPFILLQKTPTNANILKQRNLKPEDQLNETKILTKAKKSSKTSVLENSNPNNLRKTYKEPFLFNSPISSKNSVLSQKFISNQQLSPSNKLRNLWDLKGRQFSYLQSLNLQTNKTPKGFIDVVRDRNYSNKNMQTRGQTCFASPKQVKGTSKDFCKPVKNTSAKKLVISKKNLWTNKAVENGIRLKLPERQKTKSKIAVVKNKEIVGNKSLKNLNLNSTKTKDTFLENESMGQGLVENARLDDFDLDFVLSVFSQLLALFCYLQKKKDPSAILKQYTEMIQDSKYALFEEVLNEKKELGLEAKNALRIEIVTVMCVFYSLVETNTNRESGLEEAVELVCCNYYCILNLLAHIFEAEKKPKNAKTIQLFIKSSNVQNVFRSTTNFGKQIKKNNVAIMVRVNSLANKALFAPISGKINGLLTKTRLMAFDGAVELIFECFFDVLREKGAMSVVYNEDPKNNGQASDEPNFVLQPSSQMSYLPPKTKNMKLTLVLDLDETLVHYKQVSSENGEFYIRPFAQEFLLELSKYFEVVIFTAAVKVYADWIIDRIDPDNCVEHRLYRCSTKQQKGVFIKDLSRIGRELSKTIIVDNNPDNFQYQTENGIFIKSWYQDPEDTALVELVELLKFVARKSPDDVRVVLSLIRENMEKNTLKDLLGKC